MENKKVKTYVDKSWPFSSSFLWKKIVEDQPTEYRLLQYADQLRLSGQCKKGLEVLDGINFINIPEEHRYKYWLYRGMMFENKFMINDAILAYEKCIECEPENTSPYVLLGVLFAVTENYKNAEQILLQGMKKQGDLDEIYFNLSTVYARQKKFNLAIRTMEKCLKLDVNFPNASVLLEDYLNMKNMERTYKVITDSL
jgi:tetratricopeptide (TPR) repeat protein